MRDIGDVERRIRIALLQGNKSVEQFASAIKLTVGSTRNIVLGGPCGLATKQRITNYLGNLIWPGILPNERRFTFTSGTEIEFTDEEAAKEFECEIGGAVRRDGATIAFVTDFEALLPLNSERGNKLRKVRHV